MRIFIAVDVPKRIRNTIYSASKDLKGVRAKFVEPKNYHFTLKFLGEQPPHVVEKIREALREIKFEPFELEVYGVGNFRDRVVWLGAKKGSDKLIALQKKIDDALRRLKFPPEVEFIPHLTIARIKNIESRSDYKHFFERYSKTSFGTFIVDKFKLKQSILRPTGPEYIDIEIFEASE